MMLEKLDAKVAVKIAMAVAATVAIRPTRR